MLALRFIRLIEAHSEELAESLAKGIRESARMSSLGTLPKAELSARCEDLLGHLGEWLLTKSDADVHARYFDIGVARANQGIPLVEVCESIVFIKERVWKYLQNQGFVRNAAELYGEIELLHLLDRFFDRAICYTVEGYDSTRPKPVRRETPQEREPLISGMGCSL